MEYIQNLLLWVLREPTSVGQTLEEAPFKTTGAQGCTVVWVKHMEKASLAEQGPPHGSQEEKEIMQSLEARSGFTGRAQSCRKKTQKAKAPLELKEKHHQGKNTETHV